MLSWRLEEGDGSLVGLFAKNLEILGIKSIERHRWNGSVKRCEKEGNLSRRIGKREKERNESQRSQELFEEVTPLFSQRALERGVKGY